MKEIHKLGDRSGDDGAKNPESSSMPGDVQGLGMGLPDLRSKKKGKQKVSKDSHVSEALDKLTEQTREAVKGLESIGSRPGAGDIENDAMMEDWAKQFEELAGTQVCCLISESGFRVLLALVIGFQDNLC